MSHRPPPPIGTAGAYHSWGVAMDPLQRFGRNVWEGSGLKPGRKVLLSVQNLPPMAVSIGKEKDRQPNKAATTATSGIPQWINRGVVRLGGFPDAYTPLTVGCELWAIPSYQTQLVELGLGQEPPIPVDGGTEGFDLRIIQGHEINLVHVWVAVTQGSGDLVQVNNWLRHPSGIWGRAEEPIGGPSPVTSRRVFPVRTVGSDRIYSTFIFSGFPSGSVVQTAYGPLTAPRESAYRGQPFQIRFAAVLLE